MKTMLSKEEFLFLIEKECLPTYLYKYKPIDCKCLKLILGNSLYFPSPSTFNDPFDCFPFIDTNNTQQEIEQYIDLLIKNHSANYEGFNRGDFLKYFSDPHKAKEIITTFAKKNLDKCGVLCLSAKPDEILMWTHYADSHRGICLKFDIRNDYDIFGNILIDVEYSDFPKIGNYIRDQNGTLLNIIRYKHKSWSYENEYRLQQINRIGNKAFNKTALVGIIFGLRCSDDQIEKVKSWVKKANYPNVRFTKMSHKPNTFMLSEEPI